LDGPDTTDTILNQSRQCTTHTLIAIRIAFREAAGCLLIKVASGLGFPAQEVVMNKLLAIAALLLASTAAQAQYTFEYGGRTIRVDPDRGTVQIPGVYDNTGRSKAKRSRNDDADRDRPRKPSPQEAKTDPQTAPDAPGPVAPSPAPCRLLLRRFRRLLRPSRQLRRSQQRQPPPQPRPIQRPRPPRRLSSHRRRKFSSSRPRHRRQSLRLPLPR
jgi:hypothetical protein